MDGVNATCVGVLIAKALCIRNLTVFTRVAVGPCGAFPWRFNVDEGARVAFVANNVNRASVGILGVEFPVLNGGRLRKLGIGTVH